jgi:DNA-binding NtrC family response regulator
MSNIYPVLVDDDADSRRIFQLAMEHHRLRHQIFENAETALKSMTTEANIVVVDLFLPGIDGFQFFKEMQKRQAMTGVCFIATTAYYTSQTQHDVRKRGFHGYLEKPLDVNTLVKYLIEMADDNCGG